jgi:BirA family biotin operon repressor/biotin-[acetyl-CoA-carboxylase] ligase
VKQAIFGKEFIHLSDVDSTNNFAAKLLSENLCQNGAVIMADIQTQGKGQRGNTWQSEQGKNILSSFVFFSDNLAVSNQSTLTWATSLALSETLRNFNIEAQIKWPNDIFVEGKKIAGILIENQLTGSQIQRSIIGIGLNVNQTEFENLHATSVFLETGIFNEPRVILNNLMKTMSEKIALINEKKYENLKHNYETKLFQMNQPAIYEDESGKFQGVIKGVSGEGKLIIEKENSIVFYGLKEVVFIGH